MIKKDAKELMIKNYHEESCRGQERHLTRSIVSLSQHNRPPVIPHAWWSYRPHASNPEARIAVAVTRPVIGLFAWAFPIAVCDFSLFFCCVLGLLWRQFFGAHPALALRPADPFLFTIFFIVLPRGWVGAYRFALRVFRAPISYPFLLVVLCKLTCLIRL